MSVYDLFRGFFGLHRPRDPFFGGITRDDDEDEDEDDGDPHFGGRSPDDFNFGFTFGPGGMRFHDGFGFDELFRDFNDLFNEMGAWPHKPLQPFEFPGLESPPSTDRHRGKSLRDSMLKYPDGHRPGRGPEDGSGPATPERRPWQPFQGRDEREPSPPDLKDTPKEDRDLDSQVTSKGLQTILPPAQPRSYFKSVSVTKVVAPDGTVEERRTVRDSQGREETVVTRHGRGEPSLEPEGGPQDNLGYLAPFSSHQGDSMEDSSSIFNAFFRRWFPSR